MLNNSYKKWTKAHEMSQEAIRAMDEYQAIDHEVKEKEIFLEDTFVTLTDCISVLEDDMEELEEEKEKAVEELEALEVRVEELEEALFEKDDKPERIEMYVEMLKVGTSMQNTGKSMCLHAVTKLEELGYVSESSNNGDSGADSDADPEVGDDPLSKQEVT